MLKTQFKDQSEFDIYLIEQKVRQEKKYLTSSEREQLKKMLNKDYKPIFIKETKPKLPLVTDRNFLSQPCLPVTKEDNVQEIVQKLKDTFACYEGIGLSANQIGIQKRISYIKVPKIVNKKVEFEELILINAKIIEQDRPVKITNEGCLSFHGVYVTTQRFVFITVEYLNEKLEPKVMAFQDLESFAIQHESDHQNGIVIFDRKWRAV